MTAATIKSAPHGQPADGFGEARQLAGLFEKRVRDLTEAPSVQHGLLAVEVEFGPLAGGQRVRASDGQTLFVHQRSQFLACGIHLVPSPSVKRLPPPTGSTRTDRRTGALHAGEVSRPSPMPPAQAGIDHSARHCPEGHGRHSREGGNPRFWATEIRSAPYTDSVKWTLLRCCIGMAQIPDVAVSGDLPKLRLRVWSFARAIDIRARARAESRRSLNPDTGGIESNGSLTGLHVPRTPRTHTCGCDKVKRVGNRVPS